MLLNGLADTMIWDWLQIESKVFHVATYMNTIHSIIFQLIATEDGPAAAKKISKCNPEQVSYLFLRINIETCMADKHLTENHSFTQLSLSLDRSQASMIIQVYNSIQSVYSCNVLMHRVRNLSKLQAISEIISCM